jgi:hypothetical protein
MSAETDAIALKVVAFLGASDDEALLDLAVEHVPVVLGLAQGYTRMRGFSGDLPVPAIEKVIISATARLLANPEQTDSKIGTAAVWRGFSDWNPLERMVLNQYRQTAG